MVSGGFSILHDGHLDYLEGARAYGRVVVALNSDEWLKRKYGFVTMPWFSRARILNSIFIVYDVIRVNDEDGTVCEAISRIHPMYFGNGGDRESANEKEHIACASIGVIELFGLGGKKVASSSEIISRIQRATD